MCAFECKPKSRKLIQYVSRIWSTQATDDAKKAADDVAIPASASTTGVAALLVSAIVAVAAFL